MSRGKGRQKWRCKPCNKVSFGSAGRALEALDTVTEAYEGVEHKVPTRAYPCPMNNGWHLSSKKERVS